MIRRILAILVGLMVFALLWHAQAAKPNYHKPSYHKVQSHPYTPHK